MVTNEKIKEILSLLNQIRNNIGSVVVYQKEVILVRTIIISSIRSIMKSPLMTASEYSPNELKGFRKFKNTLQGLHDLVRMLSGDVWTSVALEWPVQKPTKDLFKYMQKISDQLSKFKIEIPRYSPSEDDLSADYLAIFKIFQSANGTEAKVTERLNSVSKYLLDHGVELPPSPESVEIRTIFAEIPQFHVERDDFVLENQIGRGSSGIVYKALQKSTGKLVAVKELTSMNLDKYEVASLRREVVCLSTLKHKYLIDFIGATTTSPYWLVTTFMPGNSLFARLKESQSCLGANQLTIIAYEIAEGMAYLHSKNIIHRDLKTLNILLDENMEPRIGDFGISRQCENMMTGLVGTFNYMAPEIIAKTGYNLKADIFSYGMMLWEMIKREIPFNDLGPMNAARAILNGQRPQIPRYTPKSLQQLIKDCWQVDIERRPTFAEILTRMRKELILFPGADQNELKKFYLAKTDEIQNREKEKKNVLQSISMYETNIGDMTTDILNSKDDYKYVQELINIMNCEDLIIFFIQNNGIKAIIKLFKLKNKEASLLLLHIARYLSEDEVFKIYRNILKCNEIEAAEKLMKARSSIDYTKLIEPFVPRLLSSFSSSPSKNPTKTSMLSSSDSDSSSSSSDSDSSLTLSISSTKSNSKSKVHSKNDKPKNKSNSHEQVVKKPIFLLNYYIMNTNALPIFQLEDAINLQSFESLEKLIKCNALKIPVDNTEVLTSLILTNTKNTTEQLCAVRISLCLHENLFMDFMNNSKLIKAVIKLNDIKLIGRFLYRVSQYENGAKMVLSNESFLRANISSPFILMIFIQITRFYGQKLLSSSWFISTLQKQLQDKSNIEIILRICGVLSLIPEFSERKEILIQILTLLKEDEYSSKEIPLVIGVFFNCKFNAIDLYYSQFLLLASQDSPMAGKALKALTKTELPASKSRQCSRLFDAIENFYEKGEDIDGISASCDLIKKMAVNDLYRQLTDKYRFEEKLNRWVQKLKNPHLVISTLDIFKLFGYKADQKTLFAVEEAIKKLGDIELENKLSHLYKELNI
ncbi:TKL family protein kinase [Tritrichomonas foetus]|uniref:TKL family protein kinase n=1 Tax=Tritrichomonas foetus TaxID=1144522 RepID=A0A1J4K7F7_9EUKA|nr:TKL family protein kinase [Tritrichomonas foetus]|eukprot:OHT07311.1 TKL family protein kinase [Tritrichomonas foetus]